MPAIGFGLVWLAYTAGLMGYCQIKGYQVTWGQLIRPSQALTAWPPPGAAGPAEGLGNLGPIQPKTGPAVPPSGVVSA